MLLPHAPCLAKPAGVAAVAASRTVLPWLSGGAVGAPASGVPASGVPVSGASDSGASDSGASDSGASDSPASPPAFSFWADGPVGSLVAIGWEPRPARATPADRAR